MSDRLPMSMSTALAVRSAGVEELDTIVDASLRSFYQDICSSELCGRENEMVNLYALGHLAKHVRPGAKLRELTQIGIEVTVRQLPPEILCTFQKNKGKPKEDVRKDLVIWDVPRMTLWKAEPCSIVPCNEPLAVMEWKVNHCRNGGVHKLNLKNHCERKGDIQWLLSTSRQPGMADFIGYAVLVQDTKAPKLLSCVRVQGGTITEFLSLPEKGAINGPSA